MNNTALVLCGVILVGFVVSCKGIYGDSDWMLFGGWLIAATAIGWLTILIVSGHAGNM